MNRYTAVESRIYGMRASQFRALTEHRDVVMLGDSLTEWGEWAELLPNVSVANRGIAGDTTLGMQSRLDPVLALKPTLILMMAGTNDLRRQQRSVEDTFGTYASMIDAILHRGTHVVVQSTLYVRLAGDDRWNESIRMLNAMLQTSCESRPQCTFVDVNAVLSRDGRLSSEVTDDGVHLNGSGYLRWSELIRPIIGKALGHN